MEAYYFRRLIHQQGIEWIRSINSKLRANATDPLDWQKYKAWIFQIIIKFTWPTNFADLFPNADFCLYVDYPFQQMVVLNHMILFKPYSLSPVDLRDFQLTCTFRWLAQYHVYFLKHAFNKIDLNLTIEAANKLPPCNLEQLVSLCNTTRFRVTKVWDMTDTKKLSKCLRIILLVSSYFISLLGIVTNSIVVVLISSKSNNEAFKEAKQYPYLRAISVYNVIILVIQITSWISDCKGTWDVFCPDLRKLIPIQFFKVKSILFIGFRNSNIGNFDIARLFLTKII